MRIYDKTFLMTTVAADRLRIARYGVWDGRGPDAYFRRCQAYHAPTGSVLLLTRDAGYHTSGWWKNPDMERCLHLSLSFLDPTTRQVAPRDKKLTREWVQLIFGDDAAKLWCEPPCYAQGKARETWHYRLFCDPAWGPIVPRREAYSKEFTEKGWKSFSDVQADLAEAAAVFNQRIHENA